MMEHLATVAAVAFELAAYLYLLHRRTLASLERIDEELERLQEVWPDDVVLAQWRADVTRDLERKRRFPW
jgi:hypothetical protein